MDELPTTMEQALARARAEASELRRMVEVQEAAMATAAARQQRNGDAVAYAATLEGGARRCSRAPCGAVSMMIRACTCMRPGARPPTPSGRRRSASGAGARA